MSFISFFEKITKHSVDEAGGKGASLGEMTNAGINVPSGFVLLAQAFDRFVDEAGLLDEIESQLATVNVDDMNSVDRASNVLRDVIHDTPMPEDLQKEVLDAHKKLGAEFVAVRSSATAEDSEIASWAGELETYLNTMEKDVINNVKLCWSSLFTPRAIFYRHEKDLLDAQVSVAVVIQKMVQSEVSGIAFTVHPVTEDPNQMIIEACYGLGEAIVSGQITPDSYIVDKTDMSIMDINIGAQTKKLEKSKTGVNEWIELSADGKKQKLTGKQILEAAEQFKKIEEHYGKPCDIEWALENNKLYITQSRPITTL